MLVKSVLPVDGLSYSVQKSLDPYYGNLAATASLSLLCIFIFLLYVWFFVLLYPIHSSHCTTTDCTRFAMEVSSAFLKYSGCVGTSHERIIFVTNFHPQSVLGLYGLLLVS